ncbi:MAG: zinc ABC transporter substrate-binding protein, partial [Rhodospirillaceae bacterium]|nr:zinc ABC transporter substrate-binding protein [Rhodospirillaceae bacterium]
MKKTSFPKAFFVSLLTVFGGFTPNGAMAGSIDVVSSIRPLHALVLAVADGVFTPKLLISERVSAHNFTLKASDAKKIEKSDIIFWIGPELERSLEKPIAILGANARVVSIMNDPTISLIPYNNPDNDHKDEGGHKQQNDPHIWLSSENAIAMVGIIEKTLIQADPANGAVYAKNAKTAKNRIKTLKRQVDKFIQPIKSIPFVIQHDGFSYLVKELGLNQRGYITNIK